MQGSYSYSGSAWILCAILQEWPFCSTLCLFFVIR